MSGPVTSSETQGQIKGARESLNGRENIYGTKKSKERREEPLGTMSYQTSSKRSSPFFTFLRAIYFSARLDFSSSPLSAPGSPRMALSLIKTFADERLLASNLGISFSPSYRFGVAVKGNSVVLET